MQDPEAPNPATVEFWAARWRGGQTGWDLGGAHPFLVAEFVKLRDEALLKEGAHIWVPGCGRGHCAASLAQLGYQVWATDIVTEAIEAAKQLYRLVSGLSIDVGDALELPVERRGTFDAVFDRAVLCAIGPQQRANYCSSVFSALRPGGLFVTFAFTKTAREDGRAGPPFGIPVAELHHLFRDKFTLVSLHERDSKQIYGLERAGAIVTEAVAIYRRREVTDE